MFGYLESDPPWGKIHGEVYLGCTPAHGLGYKTPLSRALSENNLSHL
jgi:hypothetical protein